MSVISYLNLQMTAPNPKELGLHSRPAVPVPECEPLDPAQIRNVSSLGLAPILELRSGDSGSFL